MIETLQSVAHVAGELIAFLRSEAVGIAMVLGFVLFVRYAAARMGKE